MELDYRHEDDLCPRRRRPAVRLLLLALLPAAMLLAACGGGSSDDSGGGSTSASGDGSGKHLTIAFANPIKGHPYFGSMECGARREADRLGVELKVVGNTQYSVGNFTQVLNAAGAQQPDGVVVPVMDPSAYFGTISNLASGGAKVVGLDGKADNASNLLSNVLSDNIKGGELAAAAMLTKLRAGDKVLVIEKDPASTVQAARGQGLIDKLRAAGVEVLPVQYSSEDVTKTTSIVEATLAKTPDLAGIYVTNGTDGPPSEKVVAQEGKQDQVAIVEYDASPEQVQRVKDGTILATVAQRPDLEAALGVRYIVDALNGRTVPRTASVQTNIVTRDNVDAPTTQQALYRVDC